MKKIILFTMLVFISITCFSQDLISLKKGGRLEVIVTEITPTLVRYKLFSEPKGHIYFMYKDDIAGIMYQDGRVETFNQSDEQEIESQSSSTNQNQRQDNQYQYQNQNQYQYQNQQSNAVVSNQNNIKVKNSVSQSPFSQFHVGVAFPSGNFSDENPDNEWLNSGKGYAAMGFTAGYKYYSPALSIDNLTWVFGFEVFYNGLNSDVKDSDVKDSGWDVTYPMYFNIPITIGLNYAIPLQNNLKLYGEAAIGGNFSLVTKKVWSHSSGSYTETGTINFAPAFGFTYGLEAGLFINSKYSIGLRYNNLGSYKYKWKSSHSYSSNNYNSNETTKGRTDKALSITNTSICLGILF